MLRFIRSQQSIRNNSEFSEIIGNGCHYCHNNIKFVYKRNALPYARFAVSVAKRRLPLAVSRSLTKRLHREAFRLLQQQFAGFDIIVMPKQNLTFAQVFISWELFCKSLKKS